MKRHLNTLFQRKRVEFEGASHTHMRSSEKPHSEPRVANLQANDGYDWLRQIKQVQPSHVATR